MRSITELERLRQQLQVRIDSAKTLEERNRLGQFATPSALSRQIAEYVANSWHEVKAPIRFLEPAIGSGSFYSALLEALPAGQIEDAIGFDIDPEFVSVARDLWDSQGLSVRLEDFTRADPPTDSERLSNLIITNPPYVRHHHLDAETKEILRRRVQQTIGIKPSGLSGLYVYFMLLAHQWMASDALGVWLIPTEFMNVNYGEALRDYLTSKVELERIHCFEPTDVQFADALVSSTIVVFRHRLPDPCHEVELSFGGTLMEPRRRVFKPLPHLAASDKWLSLLNEEASSMKDGVQLGDLFEIRRGVATGANEFFIIDREKAATLGLPDDYLQPVLPSPRSLKTDIVESAPDGFPAVSPQRVLLNCDLSEEEVRRNLPALWAYLEHGKQRGVANSYLARTRSPWYKQDKRDAPMFLCTYMGRPSKNRDNPFRIIWNRSRATATNVYLLLYPKPKLSELLREDPALESRLFDSLSHLPLDELVENGRIYGGGLHKLEPRELARVRISGIPALQSALEPPRAVQTDFHGILRTS